MSSEDAGSVQPPKPDDAALTPGPSVETVTGPVPSTALGTTLIHEHLVIDLRCYWNPADDPGAAFLPLSVEHLGRIRANPFAARDNLVIDEPRVLVDELRSLRHAGAGTIVDVTPDGIGRDPRTLVWLAERSGMHIVAGCGYYIGSSHPPGLENRSVDELAAEMVRDLTVGIRDTGIRAGVIGEIGMGTSPMHPNERTVLEAAALAQQETGRAIVAHSAPGDESPFEVAEILQAAGADMTRVVHSHLDDRFRADIDKYRRLAATGANLALDTFGRELFYEARKRQLPSDDGRVDAVVALLDAGLIEQVLLSQDICFRHELAAYGGHGYDHVLRRIVPRLEDRGVSWLDIQQILRLNPARVLAGTALD